jgi:mono/diheme cytochrome c family protein
MCHDAGENSRLAPALRGAPSIVARDPQEAILSILKGRNNRSAAAPGIMPAQAYLSDREIAAIVTYIRTEYGPHGDAVQPADVARLRAANAR